MSSPIDDQDLEEGEIEDEEDDIPLRLKDLDKNIRVSLSVRNDSDTAEQKHDRRDVKHKHSRRSYSEKSPRREVKLAHASHGPVDSNLPPLTRGGYWAPPPTTLSTDKTSTSPGSRVFHCLKSRGKHVDGVEETSHSHSHSQTREVENRRSSSENRPLKRKAKSQHPITSRVPLPQADEENDYERLLRKHKEIQEQLARLRDEETRSESDFAAETVPVAANHVATVCVQTKEIKDVKTESMVDQALEGDKAESAELPVGTEPTLDVQIIEVAQSTEQEVLDDDDLDALELRRKALESVMDAASRKATSLSNADTSVKRSSDKKSHSKSPSGHSAAPSSSASKKSASRSGRSNHSSPVKSASRLSRQHRKGNALRSHERKLFSPRGTVDRYGRQTQLRNNQKASQRELENRRREAEERRRQAERRRSDERRKRFEEKQRQELQREEIKQILSLKNPAEQVERFLRLVQTERPSSNNSSKSPMKSRTESRSRGDKKLAQDTADNYEEVAMEIDSDSPALQSVEDIPIPTFDKGFLPMSVSVANHHIRPVSKGRLGELQRALPKFSGGPVSLSPERSPKSRWFPLLPAFPSIPDPYAMADFPEWPGLMPHLDTWVPPLPNAVPPPPPPDPPPAPPDPPPSTPPAPPLPQSPCPETSTDPELNEDDGDEVALLREQLLKSMANKRKASTPTSGTSTPQSPGTQSPLPAPRQSHTTKAQQRDRRPRPQRFQLPVQKPVVIRLGPDSDSDDETSPVKAKSSLLGGLDAFLKQARNFVDSQRNSPEGMKPVAGKAVMLSSQPNGDIRKDAENVDSEDTVQLRQMEEQLKALRKDTLKEQPVLKALINQSEKYQANLRLAEDRVDRIQEQLDAAKKLADACAKQTDVVKTRVRDARTKLKQKLHRYRQFEEETLNKGISVCGEKYKLPVQLGKKKAASATVTQLKENTSPLTKTTPTKKLISESIDSPKTKMTVSEIAQEKTRLQKLEKEYASKLKSLKLSKLKSGNEVTSESQKIKIPRLDKIDFGASNVEVDTDSEQPGKRRRSLMDMDSSTKPNIVSSENVHNAKEETDIIPKKKEFKFSLPEGQQLQNLYQLQDEKVEKLLKTHSVTHRSEECRLHPPVEKLFDVQFDCKALVTPANSGSNEPIHVCTPGYHSPLLHFKAYRLSRYFRMKEGLQLASTTFSNKVDTQKQLCPFELQGTCNDKGCKWQHEKEFVLSKRELLCDLVAYCPEVAGITHSTDTEDYEKVFGNYADKLIDQSGNSFTASQLGVFVVNQVVSVLTKEKAQFLTTRKRLWKSRQKMGDKDVVAASKQDWSQVAAPELKDVTRELTIPDLGPYTWISDQRYFTENLGAEDLEAAVMEHPNDIRLWITLAYRKLQEGDSEECSRLDLCLNVLARALEANKTSTDLWYHYLRVYAHHHDASDIHELCQTALACAPSYAIWCQYLGVARTFNEKEKVCNDTLAYLLSASSMDPDSRSLSLLETVIYLVDLYIQSGRYKTGLQYLQSLIPQSNGVAGEVMSCLVPDDRCTLWLTCIHLSQFHHLPASLRDPANQNPGKLLSRKPFVLPWHEHLECKEKADSVLKSLWRAVNFCCPNITSSVERTDTGLALYANIVTVQRLFKSPEEAIKTCSKLLDSIPHLPDLWVLASSTALLSNSITQAIQKITEGVKTHPYCAKLYYTAANTYLHQKDSDQALAQLEQCVIALYDVDISDYKTCDPNLLYCKTLSQPVPLTYKAPAYSDGVTDSVIQEQIGALWLNYCLLLELQGDHPQAVESYETALGLPQAPTQLADIWIGYIQFHQRQLATLSGPKQQAAVNSLNKLLLRCLSSLPARQPLSVLEKSYWLDYSQHNRIVEVYRCCLPPDQHPRVYRQLVRAMPNNVSLRIRAIENCLMVEDFTEAQGLCDSLIYEQEDQANINLWKLALGLSLKLKNYKAVHKLYRRAIRKLPLTFTLWKDFLLFEVTQSSEEGAQWIINQCQKLGVNIKGFIATVSKLPQ